MVFTGDFAKYLHNYKCHLVNEFIKKNKVNNPNSIIMCVKFPGRLILQFFLCFHIQSFILSYSYNSTMTTIFNRTCKMTTIFNRTCNGKLLKIKINKSKKKFLHFICYVHCHKKDRNTFFKDINTLYFTNVCNNMCNMREQKSATLCDI